MRSRAGGGRTRRAAWLAVLLATVVGGGAAAAGSGQVLTITGSLTYLERIALSPQSVAVVELRAVPSPDGPPLLETRRRLDGRQVPVPFELRVARDSLDPAAAWVLRGAIVVDGRPTWVTDPIAVALAADAVDLGELRLQRHQAMGFVSRLACGGVPVGFGVDGEVPILAVAGERLRMRPVVSASGARYEAAGDPTTVFWSKGEAAMVELRGVRLGTCRDTPDDGTALRASGNEPSWLLTIGGEQLTLGLDFGTRTVVAATPVVALDPDGTARYVARAGGRPLAVTVTPAVCADTMSGMPHPFTVTVEHDGAVLHGCGGEPAELLRGRAWTVASLAGAAVLPDAAPTIEFDADGRIAGRASCNRFGAGYTLTGESLTFDRAFSTMMACPEPVMAQERLFLDILAGVARFRIEADGTLVLLTNDGRAIVATAG